MEHASTRDVASQQATLLRDLKINISYIKVANEVAAKMPLIHFRWIGPTGSGLDSLSIYTNACK